MYLNYSKSCYNNVLIIQPNTTYRSSTIVFHYTLQHVSRVQTTVLDLYVVFGWIIGTVREIHNGRLSPPKKIMFQ